MDNRDNLITGDNKNISSEEKVFILNYSDGSGIDLIVKEAINGLSVIIQQETTPKDFILLNKKDIDWLVDVLNKLNSDKNDQRFVTQQAMPKDEEAGIKNSPSWEEILEKEVTEVYPQDKFGDYAALAKSAFEKGMNRAKDYYEKEVVELLKEEIERLKQHETAALKLAASNFHDMLAAKVESRTKKLQEENERLKKALEKVKLISTNACTDGEVMKIFSIATEALKLK